MSRNRGWMLLFTYSLMHRLNNHQPWFVVGALGDHRPGDTRRLVGKRDRRDVVVPRLSDVHYPPAHPIILAGRRSQN